MASTLQVRSDLLIGVPMSSIVRATTIALAATVLSSVAQAQNGASCTKLGYVNPSALMEAAPGRAAAETLLTREGQGYQSHLQKLNDSLNKLSLIHISEPTRL